MCSEGSCFNRNGSVVVNHNLVSCIADVGKYPMIGIAIGVFNTHNLNASILEGVIKMSTAALPSKFRFCIKDSNYQWPSSIQKQNMMTVL